MMKHNNTTGKYGKDKSCGYTPEELVHLHEALFKEVPTMRETSDFLGFPPGFEFKKMTIWEDIPVSYSTQAFTEISHA
jgi:hypothetical protein